MWFRNLRIYRLQRGLNLNLAQLDEQLAKRPLNLCGSLDMVSRGWIYPRNDGVFIHAVNRQWLIALGVEQKLLPAAVIRQEAQARAAVIEVEEDRKVGRREFRDITDRVTGELMPKAFTQRHTTWAWIDPENGLLVVDTASDARADEFVEALLATIGGTAMRPLQVQVSPIAAMTDWTYSGDAPAGFTLDSDLELRAASQAQSAIRYVHHDIGGPEIGSHIAAGKIATKVGMTWNDHVSFVLTDKLHVKRLAFLDILKEQSGQQASNAEEQFDADFALMAGELTAMLKDLIAALGGEVAG